MDQWRAIEALCGAGWSEEAIATAFLYPVRTIQKLRLLAKIHPAMLDHMALNLPRETELRVIAAAPREEQEVVWKQRKPKRGEQADWREIAYPLQKRRILASAARFDEETARAYGISYTEDLFAPAGEDTRATTQVEAFLAAQHEWLQANLPEHGVVLEMEAWGGPKLPPRAERCYSKPQDGDMVGFYLDPRTAEVGSIAFRLREPERGGHDGDRGTDLSGRGTGTPRPEISRKGVEMIGHLRTDALHRALREAAFDDATLIGLLILALGGDNVTVHTGADRGRFGHQANGTLARRVVEGGVLTRDLDTLRATGRELLVYALSCREGMSRSGLGARVAGDAIGADTYLANMATQDLLKTLSKAALERAASAERVAPRNTGKETRAALIEHFGQGTWVLPAARFALTAQEAAELRMRIAHEAHFGRQPAAAWAPEDEEPGSLGDDEDLAAEPDGTGPAADGAEGDADASAPGPAGWDDAPEDGVDAGDDAGTAMPLPGAGPDDAARPAA